LKGLVTRRFAGVKPMTGDAPVDVLGNVDVGGSVRQPMRSSSPESGRLRSLLR
jgi:hypothetical protein